MDIIQTVESAAHSAVEAVEHPFHTIGASLKAVAENLGRFFGHPYCAPELAAALLGMNSVIVQLHQEVAELRTPCPCKPAPTSTTTAAGDAGQASAPAPAAAAAPNPQGDATGGNFEVVSPADLADFRAWQAAKAAAASFTGQA